ncbi:apolipo protein O-domain-containing protein [Mycena polygramma]|nr:apolipo protein O-domain-containing protein [Mycena polygramma]
MSHNPRQKLSLYAPPPTELFLQDTPSELEAHLGTLRRTATGQLRQAHDQVQGLVSRWIGVESRVEHRIKSLLPSDERLAPGTLYAGVAFLTGVVLVRRRALPTRALLPPLLGAAAFVHFLPRTSANIRAYAGALEDKHFPAVAERHEVVKMHAGVAWTKVGEGVGRVRAGVKGGALEAVEQVQEATGLRLMEALGVVRAGKAENKADEIAK